MIDIEKVRKGLECCSNTGKGRCESSECPYWIDSICCIDEMQSDAIALLKEQEKPNGKCVNECECWDSAYERGKQDALKEQEAKPIVYTDNPYTGLPVAHCPKCGKFARQFHMAQYGEETHYCPWCGQKVKWNG